jgi:hypothetical protein
MNKDLDERIIPQGEYREALNVQVDTSDGSDAGSLQTILGNDIISQTTLATSLLSVSAICIGSVADEKNNSIYYFIKDEERFTDYILKYDSNKNEISPLVVDKYKIEAQIYSSTTSTPTNITTYFTVGNLNSIENATNIRPGMFISPTDSNGDNVFEAPDLQGGNPLPFPFKEGEIFITRLKLMGVSPINYFKVYMDTQKHTTQMFTGGLNSSVGTKIFLSAERSLNFTTRFITAINIIDNYLYFTDGLSEPKAINLNCFDNINNLIETGTHPSGLYHSHVNIFDKNKELIVVSNQDNRKRPAPLEEQYITAIKKSPLKPPTVLLSNSIDGRFNESGGPAVLDSSFEANFTNNSSGSNNLPIGSNIIIEFFNAADYKVGDNLLVRRSGPFNVSNNNNNDYAIYDAIIEIVDTEKVYINNVWSALKATVKIKYTRDEPLSTATNFLFFSTLQQENPLYELKFAKFAYRYKYYNGQYSPFSPFSEPAFMPQSFDYAPKEGYNLGMVNQLRSVIITDFVDDEDFLPKDIVEIDILYKESNSTNIYTVKTIKYGDDEFNAFGSAKRPLLDGRISTNALPNTPFIYARTKGSVKIDAEIIKAIVPSNQLIRPYDNLPRAAKAQEIVGNRIVYANYLQNYNLKYTTNN